MTKRVVGWSMLVGMFMVGFFCGSVSQRHATAQMKEIGGMMEKAKGAGGLVGSAAELGSSITEMQEHVTGLQKNLETLKKVQSALGVGK